MPFDASGTFTRTGGGGPGGTATGSKIWQGDAAAGIKILASSHDVHDQDLANGLSLGILRDGRGAPVANIPWGGRKITNMADPTADQDAATKHYVDNAKTFTTGMDITGAGPTNGFINFTSPTGVNGIGWTTADMSWIGRVAVVNQSLKALAINDAKDGSGTDVFSIDEFGRLTSGAGTYAHNAVFDGVTGWRTPAAGIATVSNMANGSFNWHSTDVATSAAWQAAPLHNFASISNNGGSAALTLDKTNGASKAVEIYGSAGGVPRWLMRLGNESAETGTDRVGSDFVLYSFNNAGASPVAEIAIIRSTHLMTTAGPITSGGLISSGGNFTTAVGTYMSTGTGTVLSNDHAGGGIVYLRPNGNANATGQVYATPAGDWNVPEGGVFVAGGGVAGGSGITLNESGYGDFARAGTTVGAGFCRFLNNNGIIGSITSASATSVAYATTSDERLKDVIGDYAADAAIAIIRADPVKAFTWKASGERAVGWLAQRSYALDRNLAVPPEMDADGRQVDENDRWGIDYGKRTPYLWAALAAALDKIDALTARIEALEAAT